MARKKKAPPHEEHVNHERWLVTYADTITLLMVLFIVLFAISQVDQKKFNELAAGMAAGFGQPVSITDGGTSVLPNGSGAQPMADAMPTMSMDAVPALSMEIAHGAGTDTKSASAAAAAQRDADELSKASELVSDALTKAGLRDKVVLTRDARGLTVSVIVNDLVFPGDSAELQQSGKELVAAIAPALKAAKHDVVVEGHTNTVAAHPKNYPSEWELSSARASSVVRYLIEEGGMAARSLSVVGYADTRPLVPASNPDSSTINRRVAIVVLSSITAEQRALLDIAAASTTGGS